MGVHLISVASPGPDFAIVTRNSLKGGKAAGLWTAGGIVAANLAHILLSVGGLGLLIKPFPFLLQIIQYAGALYLFYIGVKCLKSDGYHSEKDGTGFQARSWTNLFSEGLLTSLLNPKAFLYFASLFSRYVQADPISSHTPLYGLAVLGVSALWFGSLALLISLKRFREGLIDASQWMDRGTGVILICFAVWMVLS